MSPLLPVGTAWPTVLPVGIAWGQLLPIGSGLAYNVMDYGAHADGATDDAAHVQAAVDACHAAGGGEVYMPAGEYLFETRQSIKHIPEDGFSDLAVSVELNDNVYIRGEGPGQTIVTCHANTCAAFGCLLRTNVSISDMEILSQESAGIGGINGVKFYCCDYATIDNVVSRAYYVGLDMMGCRDSIISNCTVYDSQQCFIVSEPFVKYQRSSNNCLVNCSAVNLNITGSNKGFISTGRLASEIVSPPSTDTDATRMNGVTFIDCTATNANIGFWICQAGNIAMTRCNATARYGDLFRIYLVNVDTADLQDCTPAGIVTSANDNGGWTTWGSTDCVNIVETL